MTYENIKTTILIILVLISVLLSWSLWNYQPDYDRMKNSNTVQNVTLGGKKVVAEIIKPDQVFLHLNQRHYGAVDKSEIDRILSEMKLWSFFEIKDVTNTVTDFLSFVHGDGRMEMVYPGKVPVDLYRNVLQIKDRNPLNFQFDRIVVDFHSVQNDNGHVYFISYEDQKVYEANVHKSYIKSIETEFQDLIKTSTYQTYFSYKASNERMLFLPEQKTPMLEYRYLTNLVVTSKLKKVLFTDPNLIQRDNLSTVEEYTDGLSLLRINNDEHLFTFINLAEEQELRGTSKSLIKNSIDFINQHGGWTDNNYRYVHIDETDKEILFRLYDQGYPIFSKDQSISEIRLNWGTNEVNRYIRSNFTLSFQTTEPTKVYLESGQEALNYIQNRTQYNPELLQNVVLGYRLITDVDSTVVLEPAWCFQYANHWYFVSTKSEGGDKDGLE
ncbi:YycH family regulatory protein [Bacillus sp. 03113]|uniref:YycH family regulatory protein n=1 Tax=Bacillus sp. 03113 TaxID=2578211 RepID=UPI001143C7F0|nr:two-component system activity regulator YycH [Bacillus sp. 03113]